MAYRIALSFEDGGICFIDCTAGEKVLDAAFRNDINLPMSCLSGVCGMCKCRCSIGEYDLGNAYFDCALTADEAAEGLVLTCQMEVSSDCVLHIPASSDACKVKPAAHNAALVSAERLSKTAFGLTLRPDDPAALTFLPGQYVQIEVPGTGQYRPYSFSSKPGAAEANFLIRNIEGGLMSSWLAHPPPPGASMRLVGPQGSFYLRAVDRPVIMLAGGTGLAPILSMLEVLAVQGTDQPIQLVYGVNTDADIVELARIEQLAAQLPTLEWSLCVVDPHSTQPLIGYVTAHLSETHLNAGDCEIYVCGPPPMVEAVRIHLRDNGMTPHQFYYEKFSG